MWKLKDIQNQDQSHKAKHAPIALTLLDCFSMATTKALKIQEDDASQMGYPTSSRITPQSIKQRYEYLET